MWVFQCEMLSRIDAIWADNFLVGNRPSSLREPLTVGMLEEHRRPAVITSQVCKSVHYRGWPPGLWMQESDFVILFSLQVCTQPQNQNWFIKCSKVSSSTFRLLCPENVLPPQCQRLAGGHGYPDVRLLGSTLSHDFAIETCPAVKLTTRDVSNLHSYVQV